MEEFVAAAKEYGFALELNTAGLESPEDCEEIYGQALLPYMKKYDVPVSLGADAHRPRSSLCQIINRQQIAQMCLRQLHHDSSIPQDRKGTQAAVLRSRPLSTEFLFAAAAPAAAAVGAVSTAASAIPVGIPQRADGQSHSGNQRQNDNNISKHTALFTSSRRQPQMSGDESHPQADSPCGTADTADRGQHEKRNCHQGKAIHTGIDF